MAGTKFREGGMKYMGSKARTAKHLVPILNEALEEGEVYVEPFVGGANLIDKIRKDRVKVGSDSNEYLIAFWKGLQDGFIPKDFYTREEYQHIRDNKDENKVLTGYVGFNCSYSGKWWGGYAGRVATKQGNIRDYQAEAKRNVLKQRSDIMDIVFVHKDYSEMTDLPKNTVIYCDPPYRGTTGYRDVLDYEHFYSWCRDMKAKGCKVFVSEYWMPDDFQVVWEMGVSSSLRSNGKTGGAKKSTEKLFKL